MELLFVIKDGKVSTSTKGKKTKQWLLEIEQDLLGQVSRLRKREGQKYVNFYGKS